MGEIIRVYHTDITLPDKPDDSEIEDWGEQKENQYWRRKSLPHFFKSLTRDDDGNVELTPQQENYCNQELYRIKHGFWFFLNGVATYITGRHYYYLQYWTLENRKHPEYRDTSRRYYLYLEHWFNVYWCRGVIRGKGRRSGASSESSSNEVCHVTTTKNARGGHVSKTSVDARKMFIYRMQFGFRHLPFFLQPTLANDKDSKSELVFNVPLAKTKKTKKAQLIDEVEGLNSILDYQSTATNSYDSERLTWAFIDEGGKWPADIPFDQFVSILLETLTEGSDRVGFSELPSTVNEMSKKGGAAFKRVWDDADWVKMETIGDEVDEEIDREEEATANTLVRYYCPSYDGLAGFIGKYGESIIEAPTEEQAKYLIEKYGEKKFNGQLKYGAKAFLEKKRSKLKGAALEEEIRKYSFNEVEMFMAANTECVFNMQNIVKREGDLKESKIFKRSVLFFRDFSQKVQWRDINENEKSFHWKITWGLQNDFPANKSSMDGKLQRPGRVQDGAITVDSYSNSQGGRKYGSKASAWIGRKHDINDPLNTGKAIGHLYGRPQVKDTLHDQVMLAAEYFGYTVWYEHTADDYEGYFRERGKAGYLGKYPLSLIDPTKRENAERHKGTPITPFSLTRQLDNGIAYFEYHCDKIDFEEVLSTAKVFDPYDRTAYDCIVSFLMLISVLIEPTYKTSPPKDPLIQMYGDVRNNRQTNPAMADY
jgi:hypothetical protein